MLGNLSCRGVGNRVPLQEHLALEEKRLSTVKHGAFAPKPVSGALALAYYLLSEFLQCERWLVIPRYRRELPVG